MEENEISQLERLKMRRFYKLATYILFAGVITAFLGAFINTIYLCIVGLVMFVTAFIMLFVGTLYYNIRAHQIKAHEVNS